MSIVKTLQQPIQHLLLWSSCRAQVFVFRDSGELHRQQTAVEDNKMRTAVEDNKMRCQELHTGSGVKVRPAASNEESRDLSMDLSMIRQSNWATRLTCSPSFLFFDTK